MIDRRTFLRGLAGILAAGVAPAAIGSNILMPVRKIWTPATGTVTFSFDIAEQIVRVDAAIVESVWTIGADGARNVKWTYPTHARRIIES